MSQTSLTGEAGGYAPNSGAPAYDEIRPLSVRMRDSVRAQLDVLAQLNNRSVTEETRLALEHWVERAKTDPTLKERADRVRAEIDQEVEQRRRSAERDAEHRRQAIAAVLGTDVDAKEGDPDEPDVSELDEDSAPDADATDPAASADEAEGSSPDQAETPSREDGEAPADTDRSAEDGPVPPDAPAKGDRRGSGRGSGTKAATKPAAG